MLSGARRTTCLYYDPISLTVFNNLTTQYLYITPTKQAFLRAASFACRWVKSTVCLPHKFSFANPRETPVKSGFAPSWVQAVGSNPAGRTKLQLTR